MAAADVPAETVYDRVGGQPFFDGLVDRFYAGVESDPVLRPMYPDDLTDSRRHLAGFLAQYWGGPPAYSAERGHPRLRMRHAPFPVDIAAAQAWLRHMRAALEAADPSQITPQDRQAMADYFEHAADFLRNT